MRRRIAAVTDGNNVRTLQDAADAAANAAKAADAAEEEARLLGVLRDASADAAPPPPQHGMKRLCANAQRAALHAAEAEAKQAHARAQVSAFEAASAAKAAAEKEALSEAHAAFRCGLGTAGACRSTTPTHFPPWC
jgi:hypothetical protein